MTLPPHRRLVTLLLVGVAFLVLLEMLGWSTLRPGGVSTDFRQAYGAGRMVLTEPHALYDLDRQKQVQDTLISRREIPLPFVHPAYEALLYAPFALLPYGPAYFAFIAFNVALVLWLTVVAWPLFGERLPFLPPIPGLAFFLYIPAVVAIWQGQDSIVFLFQCTMVWLQVERGRDALAGCLLALCLFRFQLALPIALLLTVRLGRRFAGSFAAASAAVVACCVALAGREGSLSFVHLLQGVSLAGDQSAQAQFLFAMHPLAMPNVFGLLFACGLGHAPPLVATGVTVVVYAALVVLVAMRMRAMALPAAMAAAVVVAVLVSHHLYLHDATLLLLPLVLVGARKPLAVGAAVFYLPLVLFFFVGPQSLFLLALPALALLWVTCAPAEQALSAR